MPKNNLDLSLWDRRLSSSAAAETAAAAAARTVPATAAADTASASTAGVPIAIGVPRGVAPAAPVRVLA